MTVFDNKDPWHVNADFMFGFQCERCDKQIDLDDVKSEGYKEQCVEMSELAQKSGWIYLDDFVFICESCVEGDKRT